MDKKPLTVSSKFPEGYGDFAIESCDGVVCYFPRQVLILTSEFFSDMFNISEEGDTEQIDKARVVVEEKSEDLELFLTHLDPRVLTPMIDPDTIEGLLHMAHRYRTDIVLRWFEREVVLHRVNRVTLESWESLLVTHPMEVLGIVVRFGLVGTIGIALKEVCGCHRDHVTNKTHYLSFPLYLEVCRLRQVRFQRYQALIDVLSKQRITTTIDFNSINSVFGHRMSDDSGVKVCMKCATKRGWWVLSIERAVQESPRWRSFIQAYEDSSKCEGCNLSWPDHFRQEIAGWKKKVDQEEAVLPVWPRSDDDAEY
jgi:hypothetical protein